MKTFSTQVFFYILLGASLNLPAHAQKKYKLNFTDNPPFSTMEGDKPSGIAVKVIEETFQTVHIPYSFQLEPLARAMFDAKTKEYNCAFPVQRAQSNEADYKWVSPISIASSGLYANPDSKIKLLVLADAKKLRLGALRGSGDAEYLKNLGYTVEEANNQDQNIQKLKINKIDLLVSDILSASFFSKQSGDNASAPKLVYIFRKSLSSLACNAKTPKADIEALQSAFEDMIRNKRIKEDLIPENPNPSQK